MADIAMLVAEEYERRVKNSIKSGEKIELLSCLGLFGSSTWIKEKLIMEEQKFVKGVLEPKYKISLAASNGFFSA